MPCPFCGGPLHPIAGRCKHCKQDVGAHRARSPSSPGFPASPGSPGSPGLAGGKPGSLPVLGGGPLGGRSAGVVSLGNAYAADVTAPRPSWLRNWPLLVILLAVVGMIIALLLLVLPQRHSTIRRNNGLSNDRMDTDSLPGAGPGKRGSSSQNGGPIDPWNSGSPPADDDATAVEPDPTAPSGIVGSIGDPDDLDPSVPTPVPDGADLDDLDDPAADAWPPAKVSDPRAHISPVDLSADNVYAFVLQRMCVRATSCGDAITAAMCDRDMPAFRPSRCFSAPRTMRCIRAMHELSCVDFPKTASAWMSIPACAEIFSC